MGHRLLLEREREQNEVDRHLRSRPATGAIGVHVPGRLVGGLIVQPGHLQMGERCAHPVGGREPHDANLFEPFAGGVQRLGIKIASGSLVELCEILVVLLARLHPGRRRC